MVKMEAEHIIPSGTLIDGKYRIEGLLGSGGMGAVYAATQEMIGRKVAVKLLHRRLASDEYQVRRFQKEAQIAGALGHDNICEVTDFGEMENGAPYLVMPLLNGVTLADLLREGAPLPLARTSDILCQTLSALEATHREKIVHRDLKPDNIFVGTLGDREDFVKLLDFGISKVLDQKVVSELTQTGTVIGTPFYMAPEQASGAKDFDHRIDIYAVGVILFQTLTGQRPYDGESYNEIMAKILNRPFPSPTSLQPDIPKEIEAVIVKAMAKDPAERFESAGIMRRALQLAAETSSLSSSSPPANVSDTTGVDASLPFIPVQESGSKWLGTGWLGRNNRTVMAVFISLVIALAIAVLVYATRDEETQFQPPPPSKNPPLTRPTVSPEQAAPPPNSKSPPVAPVPEPAAPPIPTTGAGLSQQPGTSDALGGVSTDQAPPGGDAPVKKGKSKPRPARKKSSRKDDTESIIRGRGHTHVISEYE